MKTINIVFALILAVGLFLPFNQPVEASSFPQVSAVTGGYDSTGTSHTVNLPTGIVSGDLLLVYFSAEQDNTITFPAGWTQLFQTLGTYDASNKVKFGAWYKVANGLEGSTITVTTSANKSTSHTSYRITVYTGTPEVSVTANTLNPPSLTPTWGAQDTLWFATCAYVYGDKNVSSYPSSYTNGRNDRYNSGGSGSGIGTIRRELNAVSENPDGFTVSSSAAYVSATVAVHHETSAPIVTTQDVSSIASTTATGNGNATSDGGSVITERGTVYSLAANPTTADTKDTSVGTTGAFTTSIDTLTKSTTYHVRAYGINAIGTSYGADVEFTTIAPTVTTQAATAVAPTTATGNGNITSNGGEVITEKGICYMAGVAGDPTTANSTVHDHIDTTGAYTEAIVGLTKGTAYRLRTYIISAAGTVYGVTVDLVTIDDPTITTNIASLVTSATARLNSQVSFDGKVGGGEACTVTFVYFAGSPYADYAAILAAGGTEVVAAGTYTVGQFPNYNVVGLAIGTLYSFAVKIANSTTTIAYGSVLTFTTATGISDASSLTAIPTATTVSLAWVKGLGAGYTLVRYSASGYPATVVDGTLAYLGVGNSYMLTGLTAGTTYYFSAWGKTGALYASGYATAMATTLAFDTAVSTGTLETPPTNSLWNQTPSTAKVGSIPLVSGLISANATAYAIPEASLWYFLWVLFSVGIGVFIYSKSGNNLPMSLGAQALLFALGAVLGLVMLWIMVLFMIIGAGFSLWGDRR